MILTLKSTISYEHGIKADPTPVIAALTIILRLKSEDRSKLLADKCGAGAVSFPGGDPGNL